MKTLVLTVPHSGTHFLLRFLVGVLGLEGNSGGAREMNPKSNLDFAHEHPAEAMDLSSVFDTCIITLRHPHKTLQTARFRGATESVIRAWELLIDEQENYKKTLFLVIDGPEEGRFPQLMAIAAHFNKQHLEPAIKQYADEWLPVNETLSEDDINAAVFAVRAYQQWQS